jgi:hypothetical protein
MPRIRTIKPELVTDRKLASCSREARLTWLYLITQSDDDGLILGNARQLLGTLFPHDDDVTGATLDAWIAELVAKGLVRWRVTNDDAPVVEIVKWKKHQRIVNPAKPFLLRTLRERSEGDPRETLASVSAHPKSATNDQRPTTNDLVPTTNEQQQGAATTDREHDLDTLQADERATLRAAVVDAWNEMATRIHASKILAIKGQRKTALDARLREPQWYERALLAIAYLRNDPWYASHPDAVRFDVFLRPGKVEEYVEKSTVRRSEPHVAKSRGDARSGVDRAMLKQLEDGAGRHAAPTGGTDDDE